MNKLTVFSLVLVMAALAGSERLRSVKRLPKRQIFDTIDFNTGYKSPKQNLIPGAGKKTAADYLPPTGNTYLPPISSSKSTPAPKYLIPTTRLYTTQKTTYRTLGTIPPYTGTFPTYRTSTYNYTYTRTYPTPPTTFRPLVTTATTKKIVIGYEYTTPKADFANEEIGLDIKRKY